MRWLIVVCLIALSVSCSPPAEKGKAEKPQERIISRDEAVGGLPCFKCHAYQKFSSTVRGSFPHLLHRDKGYHCNQCHTIKGHTHMKTNAVLCNDCHNIKAFTYAASGFPARFNHESHAALGCKECHPGIFQMKKGSSTIVMDSLYQGKQCGVCHNGKRAFSSRECSACHEMKSFKKAIAYKVEGAGTVLFRHEFHTQAFSCSDCHPLLFEMKKTQMKMTMEALYAGKYCGACHNGEKASPSTDCGKCHKE